MSNCYLPFRAKHILLSMSQIYVNVTMPSTTWLFVTRTFTIQWNKLGYVVLSAGRRNNIHLVLPLEHRLELVVRRYHLVKLEKRIRRSRNSAQLFPGDYRLPDERCMSQTVCLSLENGIPYWLRNQMRREFHLEPYQNINPKSLVQLIPSGNPSRFRNDRPSADDLLPSPRRRNLLLALTDHKLGPKPLPNELYTGSIFSTLTWLTDNSIKVNTNRF